LKPPKFAGSGCLEILTRGNDSAVGKGAGEAVGVNVIVGTEQDAMNAASTTQIRIR